MRRILVLATALLVVAALLTGASTAAPSARPAKKPRLTLAPASPLQGTTATFRTKVPTKAKKTRPVVLQRQVGGSWVTVRRGRSTKSGKVVLTKVVVPGESAWRLTAKRVRTRRGVLPKVVSKVRPVRPVPRAQLVSATPGGVSGGGESGSVDLSADGRWVSFASSSPSLVPGTSGYVVGRSQVFLRDRVTGTTRLVSHATGTPTVVGDGDSFWARISRDGRYVVFVSTADDLVADDDAGYQDVFRWDRVTGTTTRVSVNGMGGETTGHSYDSSVSADGGLVAFSTEADLSGDDDNGAFDVYLWRAGTGATEPVSVDVLGGVANGASSSGILSADGAYVSYSSAASDLVFNDTNGVRDIFRRNLAAGSNALVSRGVSAAADDASTGGRTAISADGRYVAFASLADNLVADQPADNDRLHLFVRDLQTQSTVMVSRTPSGAPATGHAIPAGWISADGSRVLYTTLAPEIAPGAAVERAVAVVWDRATGRNTTVLVDRYGGPPDGAVYEPVLSDDGHWLGFYSTATDLLRTDPGATSDVYVWRMP